MQADMRRMGQFSIPCCRHAPRTADPDARRMQWFLLLVIIGLITTTSLMVLSVDATTTALASAPTSSDTATTTTTTTTTTNTTTRARAVIQIVVDDLGRADLGFRNNKTTHTPTLNMMAQDGISLDSHYVFQVCAPTRASILTGRYPWGIGFYYVGGDNLGVPLGYEMTPAVLRKRHTAGRVKAHAIGKWHWSVYRNVQSTL